MDMIQKQHQKDMATSDVTAPAKALEIPISQDKSFKVVSPKDKISPQQVHENDICPCAVFIKHTKKTQPLVNKGLSLLSQ